MFEGSRASRHAATSIRCRKRAASLNGSTNADRTNYWEVVPTNALELALWMESDRMGYLLPALTDAKFQNQRDVVLNERRQNYENRPYGFAGMAIVAALYPPDHPYHWLTIGEAGGSSRRARSTTCARSSRPTTGRATRRSRSPATSTPTTRSRSSSDYFGSTRAGRGAAAGRRRAPRAARPARCACCSRIASSCRGSTWPGTRPALFADGDAELDLVAEVLAGSKTSRLYRALVYEQRIATEIAASQNSREIGGFFQIVATAAPGRTLPELERRSTASSTRSSTPARPPPRWSAAWRRPSALHLPAADRRRLRRQVRSAERLQRVPRRSRTTSTGTSSATARRPRPALQREAARWLLPDRRVALSVVPRGRGALALDGSQPVAVS